MNISAPFINRPIATTLLSVGLILAGMLGFYLLPVAPLPQVSFPTISVQASLPGASPEIMATSVATPIERQLARIAGITDMTSSSSLGSTRIIIQFDLARDIDGAARDVQAAINAATGDLPANLPSKPIYRKVNPSDAPIMIIALTSDVSTIDAIYDYTSTELQQRVLQIDGVGQVIVGGSSLPAVRVELNPHALNKYGIPLTKVKTTIASANTNVAMGQIANDTTSSSIVVNDQLFLAREYQKLIISYKDGNAVRLSDVAEVTDSVQDIRNGGSLNGKQAVALVIFKEPNANIIETVEKIQAAIPLLQSMIPANIKMDVVMDRTTTIRASLRDTEKTLVLSVIFVIIVVYAFLGSVRAMLIPSIAMIASLLGTFAVMQLLDFSLNNLSLMALTIATGFVVDDAIVVLENISRYIEMGMKPKEAALKGAKEIGFTVTSISISLIAVFIPILCMSGIVGRLFHEFAVTLSIAIAISLVISLTLTPMMCSTLLQNADKTALDVVQNTTWIARLKNIYASTLLIALAHQKTMLLLTVGTMCLSVFLFMIVPKGFFPQQDTGRIMGTVITDQDTSFQALQKKFVTFIDIIKEDAAVENVVGFIGSGSVNSGSVFISLKNLNERKISADEVIGRLRKKLMHIAGATLYMQSAQDLVIGARQGNAQFQYTISADSIEEVNKYAPLIMNKISTLQGITDLNNDQRNRGLQSYVNVDYDQAARLGVTAEDIDKTLYGAFGQSLVSTMYRDKNQYYVVMEVEPRYWQSPEILTSIYVPSANSTLVPLSSFAKFDISQSLLSLNHQGLTPSATLSFNLSPKVSLGNVVDIITAVVKELRLPISVQSAFRGTADAFKASLQNEPYLIIASLVTVYIVLGMLYESIIHPITIISSLPSAGVGALLALLLTGTDLTVIAIIGIILLIGIVKKNAIMMIDFVLETKKHENISSHDAVFYAAVLRFRPIMMTTATALLGALPLALSSGVGAEMRQPLGIAIIGGLIFSQMLTLYTTPVIYMLMERLSEQWNVRRGTK